MFPFTPLWLCLFLLGRKDNFQSPALSFPLQLNLHGIFGAHYLCIYLTFQAGPRHRDSCPTWRLDGNGNVPHRLFCSLCAEYVVKKSQRRQASSPCLSWADFSEGSGLRNRKRAPLDQAKSSGPFLTACFAIGSPAPAFPAERETEAAE